MRITQLGKAALVAGALTISAAAVAEACSRFAWTTEGHGVFAGRSMDWAHSFDDILIINPRGQKMDGGSSTNSVEWTSKYGSVVASIHPYAKKYGFTLDDGATDGINEAGLAVHLLYLEETQYGDADDTPGVTFMRVARYLLDNFATVEEAVAGMKDIRVEGVLLGKEVFGTHYAIEDASGDSAIFEILDGEMVIHHGPEFNVMTNDPSYDWQIKHLAQYQGFGGVREIPGGVEGYDRFVRLAHYAKHLPEPDSPSEGAAHALSAINAVAVPFGAPYLGRGGELGTYPTWWTSVTDIDNRTYYFNWTQSPNIVWVNLNEVDLSEGSGTRFVDPKAPALVGDVSNSFLPVQP